MIILYYTTKPPFTFTAFFKIWHQLMKFILASGTKVNAISSKKISTIRTSFFIMFLKLSCAIKVIQTNFCKVTIHAFLPTNAGLDSPHRPPFDGDDVIKRNLIKTLIDLIYKCIAFLTTSYSQYSSSRVPEITVRVFLIADKRMRIMTEQETLVIEMTIMTGS